MTKPTLAGVLAVFLGVALALPSAAAGAAPPAPALTTPVVNSAVSTLRPTLKWKAVRGATRYHVRIATNFSASTPLPGHDLEVTGTTYTPTTDVPQGEYWFAVEAKNAAGEASGFAEKRRFVVNISQMPANGARITAKPPLFTPNVVLTWKAVAGASYGLEVATDSSFTALAVTQTLDRATYTVPMLPVGIYYWRVSVNGASLPIPLARSFTVTPAPPKAPAWQTVGAVMGAVGNNGVTNDVTPVFDWTVPANWVTPPVGSSITYEMQLSTNRAFSPLVGGAITGIPGSDFEWPNMLAPGASYFWRVRAVTNLGVVGAFSKAYRFTVDTQAPLPPALVVPVLNEVVTTLRPTLKWKPVAGTTRYHVRIATNFSASTPLPGHDLEVTGTTYTPTIDVPQGEYWFAVEARDAAGNWSGFGERRRMVVNISQGPANGANVIVKAPTYRTNVVLTWTRVPGATYTLEIASDSSFADTVSYGGLTRTSYTLEDRPAGVYFWRVSLNGVALPLALARHFVVTPAPPVAPAIQTTGAISGAVTENGVSGTTPIFDWTVPANWVIPAPGQSITYELQLATDSAFANLVGAPVTGIPSSDYQWPSALTSGTKYYWRVRAVTNLLVPGAFSKVYAFTVN